MEPKVNNLTGFLEGKTTGHSSQPILPTNGYLFSIIGPDPFTREKVHQGQG